MLSLPSAVQIYLASEAVDMRRGFDGLSAMVTARGLDVFSGHLYVFVSKRRDRVKILAWDRGGFVLYYKRLERGRFRLPPLLGDTVRLDGGQLAMLLDGVDLAHVRRNRPWRPPSPAAKSIDTRSDL
jgi:transposase